MPLLTLPMRLITVLLAVCVGCALFGLSLDYGLPGHLSVDSLVQLYEAKQEQSFSFNPPLMSILLSWIMKSGLDPAKSFVVFLSGLYALAATLILLQSRSLGRVIVAGALLCNPIIILYSGNVWKDVLMAHSVALAASVILLAQGKSLGQQATIALALLLLNILIIGSRQQGLLFALMGSFAFSLIVSPKILKRLTLTLSLFLLSFFINSHLSSNFENNKSASGSKVGLTIAIRYDLAGMLAKGAQITFPSPEMEVELSGDARSYSPQRVDTLKGPAREIWGLSIETLAQLWLKSVYQNPRAYFEHRLDHFSWVMGTHDVKRCLPHYFGVSDYYHSELQKNLNAELNLQSRLNLDYSENKALVKSVIDTVLYQHWFYLSVLSFLCLAFAILREWPAMLLSLSGLGFSLSFLFVSIACDFRYVYSSLVLSGILAAYLMLKIWTRNDAKAR